MRYIFLFLTLFAFSTSINAKDSSIDVSMVISGGISLGAYEAGYNWAIVNLLKKLKNSNSKVHPKLLSVSGASAGSINALITGIYWCQSDDTVQNSVDNNLFFNTWTDIDINDLIIHGDIPENNTTLFTRKPIINKANKILKHMSLPIYTKGCQIPLGITVTKNNPIEENYNGVKIKTQSFAIPLTIKEQNGHLSVKNRDINNSIDHYLHILKIPDLDNNVSIIKNIIYASSAFPGAFKQIELNYLYTNKKKVSNGYFIDGGIYNNIPLDLSINLAPKNDNFLFINPNTLRDFNPNNCKNREIKKFLNCKNRCIAPRLIDKKRNKNSVHSGFLSSTLLPLLHSVEIFRSLNLYHTIDKYFRPHKDKHLIVSSRYHPITGNFMFSFGAFLDKSFREYDYYVGVYDAIYSVAKEVEYMHMAQYPTLPQQMEIYKKLLNIQDSKDALHVYNMLLKAEFCNTLPSSKHNRFDAIYNSFNLNLKDKNRYTIGEFKKFLKKLLKTDIPIKEDSFLAFAKNDLNNWYKPIVETFIDRIALLENKKANQDSSYTPIAKIIDFTAFLSMSHLKIKQGLSLQPMLIPKSDGYSYLGYKLLPHEFAIDSKNGGFSLGYSLYWYKKMAIFDGAQVKLSYNQGEHVDDHLRLDINPFINFKKSFTFGAGVSLFGNLQNKRFWERKNAFGANAYIDYSDLFRLTYVQRFNDKNRYYLYFGIKNLSSLLYWLNR